MKGSETFSQGEPVMPAKHRVHPWNSEQFDIAQNFVHALARFDPESGQQNHLAAHTVGYNSYADVPTEVRSAIAAIKKRDTPANINTVDMALAEWGEDLRNHPDKIALATDAEIVGPLSARAAQDTLADNRRHRPLRP